MDIIGFVLFLQTSLEWLGVKNTISKWRKHLIKPCGTCKFFANSNLTLFQSNWCRNISARLVTWRFSYLYLRIFVTYGENSTWLILLMFSLWFAMLLQLFKNTTTRMLDPQTRIQGYFWRVQANSWFFHFESFVYMPFVAFTFSLQQKRSE